MVMQGANADQLDALAKQMQTGAQMLERAAKSITSQLNSSPWEGSRAQAFRSDWSRTHRGSLLHTAANMTEAANLLRRNANDQRNASAGSGGRLDLRFPSFHIAPWGGIKLPGDFLANARRWFDDARGVVGAGMVASWIVKNRSVLGNLTANARNVFHLSSNARTAAVSLRSPGVAFAGIGVAMDGWDLSRAIGAGDSDRAIRAGIGLTIGIAGAAVPVVGQAKAAWDAGYIVGKGLSGVQQRVFNTEGKTVDWAAQQYGTQDIGNRYSGWRGFGRWVKDSARIK